MQIELPLPRDKYDMENATALVALGWHKVECVAPKILEWLQDINWPVASIFSPLLVEAGVRLTPFLRPILNGGDAIWTLNILQAVVSHSPALANDLTCELERLANFPTTVEQLEGVPDEARKILMGRAR